MLLLSESSLLFFLISFYPYCYVFTKVYLAKTSPFFMYLRIFQLTRPRKARLGIGKQTLYNWAFQLTRPRKARHRISAKITQTIWFQLTRPRKARHFYFHHMDNGFLISTHAPTQGATQSLKNPVMELEFQLTRPRKARRSYSLKTNHGINFNSRAHARRDASMYCCQ